MTTLKELTIQKLESETDLGALIEGDIIEARLPDYEGPVAVIEKDVPISDMSLPLAFIRRGKKNSKTIISYSPSRFSGCWVREGQLVPWGIKTGTYSGGDFYNKCLNVLDKIGI